MANLLLYIYCFSLPYQAITIGGIAIVKITGLLLSGWLVIELGFKRFKKSDLFVVFLVSMAPLYLLIIESTRVSAAYAIDFYSPFISNVLLFILMILSSHTLNFRLALMMLVISSFVIPILMFSPFAEITDNGRITALGLNLNISAIFLSLSFVYLSIEAQKQKTNHLSIVLYLLAIVPLLGVISTGTRFGMLICGFFICIFLYKKIALKIGKFIAIILTALFISTVIPLVVGLDLVVIERFMQLSETFTTSGRLVLWALALDAVGSDYLFGIGPNTFSSYIVPIMGSFMSPHNVFFEFYIYGGLIGTFLCLPILNIAISGLKSKSSFNKRINMIYFSSIILISIILLHHIVFNKLFWFLLAYVYRSSQDLDLLYENNHSS